MIDGCTISTTGPGVQYGQSAALVSEFIVHHPRAAFHYFSRELFADTVRFDDSTLHLTRHPPSCRILWSV